MIEILHDLRSNGSAVYMSQGQNSFKGDYIEAIWDSSIGPVGLYIRSFEPGSYEGHTGVTSPTEKLPKVGSGTLRRAW